MASFVSKSKKLKYRAMRENEVLDISLALSQTAALLDELVRDARKKKDAQLLLQVTDRWIAIARIFNCEESDDQLNTNAEFEQYGFVYEKEVKDNDDSTESTEDKSRS